MIGQAATVSIPKRAPALTPKMETVLSTDQLVKIYGGRAVVDGVNMHVGAGEIVGLLGPNGAGKTTSFYMIVGLVRPNSGRVIFCDTDVTDYPMYKRARLGMGYLPQEESIFRKMTVEQNIMAIFETLSLSKAERRNRCDQLLHQFGIERIAKNTALTLSGGEKRRLTIARSLVTQPRLLMLDEPFSGVDPIAVYDVQQIIVNLRKSGLAIMITDHNVRETLSIVDRAYLIYDGASKVKALRISSSTIPSAASFIWANASKCDGAQRSSRAKSKDLATIPFVGQRDVSTSLDMTTGLR